MTCIIPFSKDTIDYISYIIIYHPDRHNLLNMLNGLFCGWATAQKLGLVESAPVMTKADWKVAKDRSHNREDSQQPCVICKEQFGTQQQVSTHMRWIWRVPSCDSAHGHRLWHPAPGQHAHEVDLAGCFVRFGPRPPAVASSST